MNKSEVISKYFRSEYRRETEGKYSVSYEKWLEEKLWEERFTNKTLKQE